MSVDDIIWELEPHTHEKHEILKYYLGAWFPILALTHPRVIYYDGFAGPGEYKGGEDGSPIIAIKVANEHLLKSKFKGELVFLFIEADEERADYLKHKIEGMLLPANFNWDVKNSHFEKEISKLLDDIDKGGNNPAPSFFFIDPFGSSGYPMDLIRRISKQQKAEVLINFSYQSLNQYVISNPDMYHLADQLFGDDSWRGVFNFVEPREKMEFLRKTYQNALETTGWRVNSFLMINRFNQPQYYLFFATKNPLGMSKMKEAMWHAAPKGDFSYSDFSNPNQLSLLDKWYDEQHAARLAETIYTKYRGKTVKKKDLFEDMAWDPGCIERHLRMALLILEYECDPPCIVKVTGRKKIKFYPPDCSISFS
jgi:three-Cys-motif partner protein